MAGASIARIGFAAMMLLAVAVALFSARFAGALADLWLGVDPDIRRVVIGRPTNPLREAVGAALRG